MSISHVHRIIEALGSDTIERELSLSEFSIRAAKRDRLFPASWYGPLSALCDEHGIECPLSAFRWKEGDKKTVTSQGGHENIANGTDT